MAVAVAVHEIQLVGSDRLPTFSKFFSRVANEE